MRLLTTSALLVGLMASQAWGAGDIKNARAAVSTVYKRLASVAPTVTELEGWAQEYVAAENAAAERAVLLKVADAAVLQDTFYSRAVLNFADPETNENMEVANQLTDMTATIVGMVRDEVDYRQILYGDQLYIPDPTTFPPYSIADNETYTQLYNQVVSGQAQLSQALQPVNQRDVITQLPVHAGIFTTRGYGSVFYNDGTNRSPLRFTMVHYACRDLEQLSDITRPDVYVRRDVERTPGGDGEKFRTECVGCHAGMDPMTKAFSYIDFDIDNATVIYSEGQAVPKVNRNPDTFPNGYAVRDDAWSNIWTEGSNANLGWNKEMLSGNGPKSWGESIATTTMFPECMAQRVYKTVCFKKSFNTRDRQNLRSLSKEFVDNGYNMKDLFKKAAVQCVDNLRI
ncbi:MAG: hypothetical protein ACOH5I_14455 [Oligoflexus sp.]